MYIPSPLSRGDAVALIAPASPFRESDKLSLSEAGLRAIGLEPVVFPSCQKAQGYLAGTDEERARDLHDAFRDPLLRGVFCMRGGYGTMRLLPHLDFSLIRANPKLFCGLSDITALHLAFYEKAQLSGLHAPMPFRYPELPEEALSRLKSLLFDEHTSLSFGAEKGLYAVSGTHARGALLGGNLSLVASLIASDYCPDFSGKILFLEEIGEEPYRVDRLLTSLKLAGVFDTCAGVLFGAFTDCGTQEQLLPVFRAALPPNLTCLAGFPAGHLRNNFGFFEGQNAELFADKARLLLST